MANVAEGRGALIEHPKYLYELEVAYDLLARIWTHYCIDREISAQQLAEMESLLGTAHKWRQEALAMVLAMVLAMGEKGHGEAELRKGG